MTKTEARKQAARHLSRAGYFAPKGEPPWASCPRCPSRVPGPHLPWEKPFPAVRTALATHLIEEH